MSGVAVGRDKVAVGQSPTAPATLLLRSSDGRRIGATLVGRRSNAARVACPSLPNGPGLLEQLRQPRIVSLEVASQAGQRSRDLVELLDQVVPVRPGDPC